MCGIAGAAWFDPDKALSSAELEAMTRALRHRGPDDEGRYRSELRHEPPRGTTPGVALGFRRLAIIDLATGHQPIPNEDESIWLVFNGEIYNYQALRHRLEGAGHSFRSQGDAETIVHLYEDLGTEAFQHLNGMFALAIWDGPRRRLVLARDRLGQKPLVYHATPERLTFASELKSLLEVRHTPRRISPAAIDAYLTYQYIPHPHTVYEGIRKLPPGHLGIYESGKLRVAPYWTPDWNETFDGGLDEAQNELGRLLEDAVAIRLQSDVPLGGFLSGGVDSSVIVALMNGSSVPATKTFAIGFPVAEYDESDYAAEVARRLGTDHYSEQVTPDAVAILDRLVWHYDEPFADSSAVPTWYLARMTRRHVTVCLSGDGGDELFLGYPRYRAFRLADRVDRFPPARDLLGLSCWQRLPVPARQKSRLRQFARFCQAIRMEPLRRYADWIAIFNETHRGLLYRDAFLEQLGEDDPFRFLQDAWDRANRRDHLTRVSIADLLTYLPCDLMTKVDTATMAHSLECRQPFLDYRLVEFAMRLPAHWKLRGRRSKWILRRLFERQLPKSVFQRAKMGFGVPLDHWFRGELAPLARDLLLAPDARTAAWFRRERVEQLLDEHLVGRFNHAYRLWSLVVLEKWLRRWQAE